MKCEKLNTSIGVITWTFNGLPNLELHMERIHANCVKHAAMHGFKQKIGDTAALERDKFPGGVVPEAVKRERMLDLVEYFESGAADWNRGRAASVSNDRAILARAWEMVHGQAPNAEKFKALTADQVSAMLVHATLKDAVDTIRAEMVGQVDVDALFEGM